MRLILYTGKGGVGKSSIAAATAVKTSQLGKRTLLVSSDYAHNISDIFQVKVGDEPLQISDKLFALEVDTLKEIRDNWAPMHEYFTNFLEYLGMENAVAEEVALFPGIDDLFLLSRILKEAQSSKYDVIIVDCSPTAGTLRHLTLSDSACSKMNKFIDVERKILKLVRPFTKKMKGIKEVVPEDEVYKLFQDILGKVGTLGEMLKDPNKCSIRLVLNPDRISIAETRRSFTYLGLFGFPIDGIFINKIFPMSLSEGYLHDWCDLQKKFLESIDRSFLDVAKFNVPLLDIEPVGIEALGVLGEKIYGDNIPDELLSSPKTAEIKREDDRYILSFWLPNIEQSELDVGRKDGELIVKAGHYTRVFTLPDTLIDKEITEAKFREGTLVITFE